MDFIKQWVLVITAASILCAVVMTLIPSGPTKKTVNTAVSLFLMCVILNPFISGIDFDKNILKFDTDIEINTSQLNDNISDHIKNSISVNIKDILYSYEIKNPKIDVEIEEKDNQLNVKKIMIYTDKINISKITEIKNEIRNKLGVDVEFEVSE